jgi:hypothetical protein
MARLTPEEAEWTQALAELRFLDEEADTIYAAAAAKIGERDDEASRELHRFRASHAEHAERIDDAFFGRPGPPEIPEDVKRRQQDLEQRVVGAVDPEDLMRALYDAELTHAERYQRAAKIPMPDEAKSVVVAGLADERAHLDWIGSYVEPSGAGTRLGMGEKWV